MKALIDSPPHERMRRVAVIVSMVLPIGLAVALFLMRPWSRPFVIPDEKIVAAKVLDSKLRGPRYFHPTEKPVPPVSAGGGEIRIGLADANSQVPSISRERRFSPEQTQRLQKLVDSLAEPSPSRMTGETTINLLRLNLALDELR